MARNGPDPTDLPDNAGELADHAETVLRAVERAGLSVATAESCTGGLIASLFTDIEGLSNNFDRGFVTYSVAAKCELLESRRHSSSGTGWSAPRLPRPWPRARWREARRGSRSG